MTIVFGNEHAAYAKIIADSVSPAGVRLTTMEVQCHRFVLAEFNTHRAFSRNSASSRAIPVHRQLERVTKNPAVPLSFPAEQRGMQGGEELTEEERFLAHREWLRARDAAVKSVETLLTLRVHKSVTNRLLEPFMWHKIIVSATEWENFFTQRCSPLAQPEIRAVAEHMRDALSASVPQFVSRWHLPYIQPDELGLPARELRQLSAARCARVSYLTHDGERDHGADFQLFQRLVSASPPHWSPLEHVATPDAVVPHATGNFGGWIQLRQLVQEASSGQVQPAPAPAGEAAGGAGQTQPQAAQEAQ